ncbi:hypothetical protein JCM3775_001285 [Rhodotorula graminis]|uniref:Uncharacterized protein n=1 Tax=Rhodotorula graminis (strain WP1) TaxID=578459 RepID=A0A194S1S1_RHOGW|nr:uncharacterized protein RHOBADRAFT_53635 [Rhodotorula graminis WP1]KPV74678.1 hypothetical protein RHOBADRAFT_53635 [Rhodotorula graminis WP1]
MGRHRRDSTDGVGDSADDDAASPPPPDDADAAQTASPRFDPRDNLRFRHETAFLVGTAAVAVLDFALAGLMVYEHFGNPAAVWGVAVAISLVEGLFIAVSVALIELHVGTTKHWDLVLPLCYVWTGSLAINVTFCLGASEEKATFPVLFPTLVALAAASQAAGLALALVGARTHILLTEDPEPDKHGFRAHHGGGEGGHGRRHRWGRHRHGRRRRGGASGSEGDA